MCTISTITIFQQLTPKGKKKICFYKRQIIKRCQKTIKKEALKKSSDTHLTRAAGSPALATCVQTVFPSLPSSI